MASPYCLLGTIRESLDSDQRKELDFMLSHPDRFSTRKIARALTEHGHPVKKDCVHSHMLGDCRCPR